MDDSKLKDFFSKDQYNIQRLLLMFDNEKSIPTFLNLPDHVEFAERIDRVINFINESNNFRLIVIETWLIIDYSIRQILKYGLEIDRFTDENFNILPQGFRDSCTLLQNFIKQQKSKSPNPSKLALKLPKEFNQMIMNNKRYLNEFIKLEREYYKLNNIQDVTLIDSRNNQYRNVDDEWLNSVSNLNDEWFSKANRLNNVRNFAAHAFDDNRIFKELGLNGDKKLEGLKSYCRDTLKDLVGLK